MKPGEKPNLRSYLDGVWSAGNTRRFSDLGFDPDTDVSIDDSQVDYNTPGVYTAYYKLSKLAASANGTFRTSFGTTSLVIVVEDVQ